MGVLTSAPQRYTKRETDRKREIHTETNRKREMNTETEINKIERDREIGRERGGE